MVKLPPFVPICEVVGEREKGKGEVTDRLNSWLLWKVKSVFNLTPCHEAVWVVEV